MISDVTIAIFVHNALDYLKTTLYSLEKNTSAPYRLLLIDDASDAATKAHLRNLKRATLITNHRQMGFPHNANLAIEHSDTSGLVLLNSDVYVTPGWLSMLLAGLNDKPVHGIAGPSTCWAKGEQHIIHRPSWTNEQIENFGALTLRRYGDQIKYLERWGVCGFCYAFKRELVEKIGYFDEAYGLGQWEETDYNTRAALAGYKGVWVCGTYVHHYGGKSFPASTASALLQRNRKIYQDKFRSLPLNNTRDERRNHCVAAENSHFKQPADLTKVFRQTPEYTIKYL